MVGFAKIPLVRGDTDDDASIHLHSHVGPSKPISCQRYDREIMDILNTPNVDNEEGDLEAQARKYNLQFQDFTESSPFESDNDEELTQVEDDLDFERVSLPKRATPKTKIHSDPQASSHSLKRTAMKNKQGLPSSPSSVTYGTPAPLSNTLLRILRYIIAFYIGATLLFLLPRLMFGSSESLLDLTGVNARIDDVSERVGALNEISYALDQQVDLISSKQENFVKSMHLKIATLEDTLQGLQSRLADESRMRLIEEDLKDCKKQINLGLEMLSSNPGEIEDKVNRISDKLAQLLEITDEIQATKDKLIREIVQKLPEHVPVYIKKGKIQYLPEFHEFLASFVSNSVGGLEEKLTWNDFLTQHGTQMKRYVEDLVGTAGVKFLSKSQFEESLHEKLASNNRILVAKFNHMLDSIEFLRNSSSVDLGVSRNRVILDNLLDVVGKGSVKVNFADYKLGARILGFLTTTGIDSYKKKSFARTMFLGWYDYLTSSGLRSSANMKFNANNILVDGGQYWQCESHKCSVGIRLSSPVILTDLIINNPSVGKPQELLLPEVVSIYIKPRKRTDAEKLEQHLKYRLEFVYKQLDNKFLAKFHKIQEVHLSSKSIEHIQLPKSIINMRIPTRDVFVEISTRHGVTGLFNLKVYGITEYNSFRFAENFESILDHLEDGKEEQQEYTGLYESGGHLLDEDYIV